MGEESHGQRMNRSYFCLHQGRSSRYCRFKFLCADVAGCRGVDDLLVGVVRVHPQVGHRDRNDGQSRRTGRGGWGRAPGCAPDQSGLIRLLQRAASPRRSRYWGSGRFLRIRVLDADGGLVVHQSAGMPGNARLRAPWAIWPANPDHVVGRALGRTILEPLVGAAKTALGDVDDRAGWGCPPAGRRPCEAHSAPGAVACRRDHRQRFRSRCGRRVGQTRGSGPCSSRQPEDGQALPARVAEVHLPTIGDARNQPGLVSSTKSGHSRKVSAPSGSSGQYRIRRCGGACRQQREVLRRPRDGSAPGDNRPSHFTGMALQ